MAHRTNSRKKKVCFCLESMLSISCCHISVYKIWCSANYTLKKQVSGARALPWHVVKDNSVGKMSSQLGKSHSALLSFILRDSVWHLDPEGFMMTGQK